LELYFQASVITILITVIILILFTAIYSNAVLL
jgi:hypothetical protein